MQYFFSQFRLINPKDIMQHQDKNHRRLQKGNNRNLMLYDGGEQGVRNVSLVPDQTAENAISVKT